MVWKSKRNVPKKPSMLLVDDLLYTIDDGGIADLAYIDGIGGVCRLDHALADKGIDRIVGSTWIVGQRCKDGADNRRIKRRGYLANRCRERAALWPQDDAANEH